MKSSFQKLEKFGTALGIWVSLIDLLAGATFLVSLSGSGRKLGLPLVVLTLFFIVVRTSSGIFNRQLGVGPLGHYMVARSLVLASIATLLIGSNQSTLVDWFMVAAAIALMVGERVLRSFNSHARPFAANFPKVDTTDLPKFRYGYIYVLNLLLLALLSLEVWTNWSVIVVGGVVAALSLLLLVAGAIDTVLRVRARLKFEEELPNFISELAPQFYLHWHAPGGTTYQIEMWLPYLERLGVPFAIIVRSVVNFREVSNLTDIPVLYRKDLEDLDPLITPSLKGVFYVNTATRNDHMVRYAHLVHIQLNHGDSDKIPSFNPVFRMYDFNFVAGQAAIERFAANNVSMPPEMFRIVGRPQVEHVQKSTGRVEDQENPTVLYAPTWGGFYEDSNYSSLLSGVSIVSELIARGIRVVFRPHPYTYRNPDLKAAEQKIIALLEADETATGRGHLFGATATKEMSIVDCFNASHAMISDVSSVVGDFLYSNKPLAMVATQTNAAEFEENFPMARAAYVLEANQGSLARLGETFDEMFGPDNKSERRAELAQYYLGDVNRDDYVMEFIETAQQTLGLHGVSST